MAQAPHSSWAWLAIAAVVAFAVAVVLALLGKHWPSVAVAFAGCGFLSAAHV